MNEVARFDRALASRGAYLRRDGSDELEVLGATLDKDGDDLGRQGRDEGDDVGERFVDGGCDTNSAS